MELSPAELAAERERHQRQFWAAFGFVTGFGTLIFVLITLVTMTSRVPRHNLSLLARMDLNMRPGDGIAVSAAMIGVVVALNIALAAQTTSTDPRETVGAMHWQRTVAFIATMSGSGSVTVTLICWTSSQRGDSTGNSVSLGLLALISIALASALKLKARSDEVSMLEAYRLRVRLATLDDALDDFRQRHAIPSGGVIRTGIYYLYGAALLSGICVTLALIVAGVLGRFVDLSFLIDLWMMGVVLEVCLLGAIREFWLVRTRVLGLDSAWHGYLLVLALGIPVAFTALLLVAPWSFSPLLVVSSFCGAVWLLAPIAVRIDRAYPRTALVAGPRASVARVLARSKEALECDLVKTQGDTESASL